MFLKNLETKKPGKSIKDIKDIDDSELEGIINSVSGSKNSNDNYPRIVESTPKPLKLMRKTGLSFKSPNPFAANESAKKSFKRTLNSSSEQPRKKKSLLACGDFDIDEILGDEEFKKLDDEFDVKPIDDEVRALGFRELIKNLFAVSDLN